MNGKKAKLLRKDVNGLSNGEGKENKYTYFNHREKSFPTGELNANGTPKVVKVETFTVKLGECQRKLYQQLKG